VGGTREPDIYGTTTYADLVALCERTATEVGVLVQVRQANHEGELIDWVRQAARAGSRVVLNGTGCTRWLSAGWPSAPAPPPRCRPA